MHELSLARDIIDTVRECIPDEDIPRIKQVVIKVGEFSGVVSDSLKFSFQAITSETDLADAVLEIISIPFRLKCSGCGSTTSNEFGMMICGSCGSADTVILSGSELQVVEVKIQTTEE